MKRESRGFTLMEMLIVIAIIAVLIAIGIPVFTGQLRRARAATDQANVRSAMAAAAAQYMSDGGGDAKTYYFDGGKAADSPAGIAGYGQSDEDLTGELDDNATGVPKGGYVKVTVNADGTFDCAWEGGSGSGGDDAPAAPSINNNSPVFSEKIQNPTSSRYYTAWDALAPNGRVNDKNWQTGESIKQDDKLYVYIGANRANIPSGTYGSMGEYAQAHSDVFMTIDAATPTVSRGDLDRNATYPRGTVLHVDEDGSSKYYVATASEGVAGSAFTGASDPNGWAKLI